MKIARFSTPNNDPRFGILDFDEYIVLEGDPMFAGYETTGERVQVGGSDLLAPVIPRSKVVGVTPEGVVYLKPNTAVVGPADPVWISGPATAQGMLGIVIGSVAKRVRAGDAGDVIFGYTVAIDITSTAELAAGQLSLAKGYDGFAPLGPVIETEYEPDVDVASIIEKVSSVWTLLPGDVIMLDIDEAVGQIDPGSTVSVDIIGIGTLENPIRSR